MPNSQERSEPRSRVERRAPTVGGRERLGRQILGNGRADPAAEEPEHQHEILLEGGFEILGVGNAPRSRVFLLASHVYVLSGQPNSFRGRHELAWHGRTG